MFEKRPQQPTMLRRPTFEEPDLSALLRRMIEQQEQTNRQLAVLIEYVRQPRRVLQDENGEITGSEVGAPIKRKRPPARAIAALKENPKLAVDFDRKFGEGSAAIHLRGW